MNTTNHFPLYYSLKQRNENKNEKLSYDDMLSVCSTINQEIDEEGLEYIYAIIRYYSLLEDNFNFDSIPYKPKINKNGLKYDLSSLPSKLALMIKDFVDLHTSKLNEEKERDKIHIS